VENSAGHAIELISRVHEASFEQSALARAARPTPMPVDELA
jgi:hypothetical protein